ncbi:DnaJ-domain-containing protein [Amylostereum chailletii]|nr:DnaJ-domain-containing protein [Amylostereum chailletii]
MDQGEHSPCHPHFVESSSIVAQEDHEIFDLVSSLEAAEGKGTTFYSWLDVPSSASTAEIGRAYRKKSMQLHPDKNPGVKGIQERFARLGVIVAILRNKEGRERYDFFYKNGVPRWRGTGYYYSRFRPGLGAVFVFLALLTSGLQYVVQRLNYKRDLGRIEHIIREARIAAWGQKMVPLETRRKVRVSPGGPPRLNEDGNVVLGKSIDMVVEPNGEVFIYEPDGNLIPVNPSTATPPAFSKTWVITLFHTLFRTVMKPKPAKEGTASGAEVETDDGSEASEQPESVESSATEATGSSGNGVGAKTGKLAAVKAGGRRKKAVRKR